MKLLIDNALSPQLALALAASGIDVVHVRDLGLRDATDVVIQERAALEGRIVVSRDGDFSALLAHSGNNSPSFVHLRIPGVNRVPDQAALLLQALTVAANELLEGAIVTVSHDKLRIRMLPVR